MTLMEEKWSRRKLFKTSERSMPEPVDGKTIFSHSLSGKFL